MNVPCTPSTPREKFRPSFDRTLNSTRLRPDGCKSRARVPSRRKRIPCRPPPKGKRNWVTRSHFSVSACPLTAWLLKKYAGIRLSGWARFVVAVLFIVAGRLTLELEGRGTFLPHF